MHGRALGGVTDADLAELGMHARAERAAVLSLIADLVDKHTPLGATGRN